MQTRFVTFHVLIVKMWKNTMVVSNALKYVLFSLLVVLCSTMNSDGEGTNTLSKIKIEDSMTKKEDYLNKIYIRTWSARPRPIGKRTLVLYGQRSSQSRSDFPGEDKGESVLFDKNPRRIPLEHFLKSPFNDEDRILDSNMNVFGGQSNQPQSDDSEPSDHLEWPDVLSKGANLIQARPLDHLDPTRRLSVVDSDRNILDGFNKRVWTARRPPSWTRALKTETIQGRKGQEGTRRTKISEVLMRLRQLGVLSWT
ncbi:uncharacterized protein [Antedon mediterranea]|uniref:uncharacterized protein n=1 Tax=Antedon mediterranea TaxID=105859 RepID=UPI003AF98562